MNSLIWLNWEMYRYMCKMFPIFYYFMIFLVQHFYPTVAKFLTLFWNSSIIWLILLIELYFFFFVPFFGHVTCLEGSYFSDQGPDPRQWKCGVLTTELQGNSHVVLLFSLTISARSKILYTMLWFLYSSVLCACSRVPPGLGKLWDGHLDFSTCCSLTYSSIGTPKVGESSQEAT